MDRTVMMRRNKSRTILVTGTVLALVHLAIAAVLVLEGGEALMCFLALDFPLFLITQCVSGVPALGGIQFWIVFGTFMYFGIGLFIGWVVWKIGNRKRAGSNTCPTCDYNLTGNVSGICPECGTPIPDEMRDVYPKQSG